MTLDAVFKKNPPNDGGMNAHCFPDRLLIEAELGDSALGVHIAITFTLAGDFDIEGSAGLL